MADKNIKAILCPRCGKLVSANAEACIHCGMKRPGRWRGIPLIQSILGGKLSYVDGIVSAAVILYVVSLLIDPRAIFQIRGIFDILSPSGIVLYLLGMTGSGAMAEGRWWTLFTAIYLHGSLLHILFNVLWIRQLGPVVEDLFGASRFFVIFTAAGVIGFVVSNMFGVAYTIGASGSIFGLLGAVIFYGRHRGGSFGFHIYRQTMQWAVILFLFGFFMSGINNFAHAGGFVGGYLTAMLLGYRELKPETLLHRRMALAALGLTGLSFLIVFLRLLF